MKRELICLTGFILSLFFFISCNSEPKYTQDVSGFEMIQNDLQKRFGADAYYTDISIINSPTAESGTGISLHLTVTKDPQSMKMQEWIYNPHTSWNNTTNITLKIPEGDNATSYMYQLGEKFDLKKIGQLIDNSARKIEEEKNIEKVVLDRVLLKTPDNADVSETTVFIRMKPHNGGTSFNFRYDLEGKLLAFDY
ncbi:MAG TPA: hypothetical protein DIT04_06275 [Dysgonomonas sp.]|nr:hypothetical protein [Dysgonomonas sp.]